MHSSTRLIAAAKPAKLCRLSSACSRYGISQNPARAANYHEIVGASTMKPFFGFTPKFTLDKPNTYEISNLKSGVTVLTENSGFPYHTDLTLLARIGSRNEIAKTAGATKMLQNLLNLGGDSQAVLENFEINQLNGGGLGMISDQESSMFRCSCNPEDTETMLQLLFKTSLSIKDFSMFDASILQEEKDEVNFEQEILRAAFGGSGVGMSGINTEMIESDFFSFQEMYLTPQRVIISAANVQSHQSFVKQVEENLLKYPEFLARKFNPNHSTSVYVGEESRIQTENELVDVGIGFKGFPWSSEDIVAIQIAFIMFGQASAFSSGGPGKGMHARATKNVLNRLSYVSGASCLSNIFTDAGLFGIKISGSSSNINDIIGDCVNELALLTKPISPIELQRAKNILKSLMYLSLERQQDRLEETTKHIMNFKIIRINESEQLIDKVTSMDVNRIIQRIVRSSRPTIVMIGDGVKKAHSFDRIAQQLIQV